MHRRRRAACAWAAGLALVAATLAGCGGASDEPRDAGPLPNPPAESLAGTINNGEPPMPVEALVRGDGPARRSSVTDAAGAYAATLQRLDPPYMLRAPSQDFVVFDMYAVALGGGTVNVTPLTTLTSVYAVGRAPAAYFDLLGAGAADLGAVTEASVARGERRVRTLLADWGIAVPARIGSFVNDPFDAEAGDPMFELIVRLRQALVTRGLTLPALLDELAAKEALCRAERVEVLVDAREGEFCTASRSTGRDGDVDVHAFIGPEGDMLTVRVAADGGIDSVELAVAGGPAFACAAAGCAGVSAATPDAAGRRRIDFDAAGLAAVGVGPAAVLSGSVFAEGAQPSPAPLACSGDGGFFHSFLTHDNRFPGSCVFTAFPGASGPADRSTYEFFGTGGDEIVVEGEALTLRVHADGAQVVSVILHAFGEPFDTVRRAVFKCGGVGFAACNGVTIVPSTELDSGFIGLDDTVLYRVDANGAPLPGDTAMLRAAELLAGPRSSSSPPDCEFLTEVATMSVSDGLDYAYCPDEANGDSFAGPFGDEIVYFAGSNFGSGNLSVFTLPGSLAPVRVEARRESDGVELFVCDQPACLAGVTLTRGPDGRITIAFDRVALQERDLINTAGDRGAVLTEGAISFAPFE